MWFSKKYRQTQFHKCVTHVVDLVRCLAYYVAATCVIMGINCIPSSIPTFICILHKQSLCCGLDDAVLMSLITLMICMYECAMWYASYRYVGTMQYIILCITALQQQHIIIMLMHLCIVCRYAHDDDTILKCSL